jgi:hypothetical protein
VEQDALKKNEKGPNVSTDWDDSSPFLCIVGLRLESAENTARSRTASHKGSSYMGDWMRFPDSSLCRLKMEIVATGTAVAAVLKEDSNKLWKYKNKSKVSSARKLIKQQNLL